MKTPISIIILLFLFTPCFSQQDLLPAFTNEISYQGVRAYFNGAPFTGVLVDEKTNVKWGVFRNGYKNGLFTEYYANGKKKSEGNYINGTKEGKYTDWYGNGKKAKEQSFENGIPSYKFLEWNDRGDLLKEGLIDGRIVNYYKNGNKKNSGKLVNGKIQGKYIKYYKNGKKAKEQSFENGIPLHKFKEWGANGNLLKERFNNGRFVNYYENGKEKSREFYTNGQLDGICRYWDMDGKSVIKRYKEGLYIESNTGNKENYVGHYNVLLPDGTYKSVDDILYYKSNTAKITSVVYSDNGHYKDAEYYGVIIKGGQKRDQLFTTILSIEGFKPVNKEYSYFISVFTDYQGKEFNKREFLNWTSIAIAQPWHIKIDYNTPSPYARGLTNSNIFYCSFYIEDKHSDAKIQGFYKYTITR